MQFATMLRSDLPFAGNSQVFVVVTPAGTTVLPHDAGVCTKAGWGPGASVWVSCASRIERLSLEPSPRFQVPLLVSGELSFTPDGGVWRKVGFANGQLARFTSGGWQTSPPACTFPEASAGWTALTPTRAFVTCRPPSGPTFTRLIDNGLVEPLGSFPSELPWVFGADDLVVANPMGSAATRLLLDGGAVPVVGPSGSAFVFLTSDGTLAAVDGTGAHWLDGTTWRRLGSESELFDARGNSGVQVNPSTGRVSFLGTFVADPLPASDPNVTVRNTSGFLETDVLRVALGSLSFRLTPTGLADPALGFGGQLNDGLPDGGEVSVKSTTAALLTWRFASRAGQTVRLPFASARALVLRGTGDAFVLLGAPDGGHLYQVDLDGGVTRVPVPIVDPDLLRRAGADSVLVGKRSPATLSEYTVDGGLRALVSPLPTLTDACETGGRWFAAGQMLSMATLFVSNDGLQWAGLTGAPLRLACGAGLVAGVEDGTSRLVVSDGGALLRVSMPAPIAPGGVTHVDAAGRVWFVSSGAEVGFLR